MAKEQGVIGEMKLIKGNLRVGDFWLNQQSGILTKLGQCRDDTEAQGWFGKFSEPEQFSQGEPLSTPIFPLKVPIPFVAQVFH